MHAQPAGTPKRIPPDVATGAAIMRECDRMEGALGTWLVQQGKHVVEKARRRRRPGQRPTSPAVLWRTLVHIWCTSPAARAEYSEELRRGLVGALRDMDDPTAMALIRGLMKQAQPPAGSMKIAA